MLKIKSYYVEIYTKNPTTLESGWDIEILNIEADDEEEAKSIARNHPLFDCVISSGPNFSDCEIENA